MVTGVIKKHIYHVVFVCVLALIATQTFAQQETMYTQYMSNVLSVNPAYAGSKDMLSMNAVSRNQWVGFGDAAPETQTFSIHSPFSKYNMGIGFSLVKDKIDPITQTGFNLDYSYTLNFSRRRYLAFGLKGGINFYSANLDELKLIDPNDAVFMSDVNARFLPNVGVGAYYYTDRFYAGLSAPKLIKNVINPHETVSTGYVNREELHLFLMAGYVFDVNRILKFKPHFMVKFVQDAPISIDFSAQFLIYERLWLGAMYRLGDSFGGLVQMQVTNQFKLGYSYDLSINELGAFNNGTHEIMISYDFNFGRGRIKSPRYF